jgi:hypothetical protein
MRRYGRAVAAIIGGWVGSLAGFGQLSAISDDWDPVVFAPGQAEITITDANALPRQLERALKRSGCSFADEIRQFPARLVRVRSHRFAIVFCRFGPTGSHQVFEFAPGWRHEPNLVHFAFLGHDRGLATSANPGAITWNPATSTLQAVSGSDMCPSPGVRHTYRLVNAGPFSGPFALDRIEINNTRCGAFDDAAWKTFWEAPVWQRLSE